MADAAAETEADQRGLKVAAFCMLVDDWMGMLSAGREGEVRGYKGWDPRSPWHPRVV